MAPSMPLPLKAQVPVTPPPEFQMFMMGPPANIPHPFTRQTTTVPSSTLQEKPPQQPSRGPLQTSKLPNPTTTASATSIPSKSHLNLPPTFTFPLTTSTAAPTPCPTAAIPPPLAGVDQPTMAMASRIAAYYQQRCAAVANFHQQRCQAWASAQRQKCQEMTQAATVVVAWYIRDRLARRRRRRTRVFRRGLAARGVTAAEGAAGRAGRITKGEAVRRWVMGVPMPTTDGAAVVGLSGRTVPRDPGEVDFDMDREGGVDKDAQLFSVADNLIKSHLARIQVPMLGVLSFEESESESEGDEMEYEEEEEDEEDEEDEEYEEEEEGEEGEAAVKEEEEEEEEELASASKDAQLGSSGKGSRKRSHSCIS
ncbi:hypothetical protein C8A05DRAFT_31374 [Staphylotrichum tortipilum]|uniref:Uncharacterized protein n=1 Tax=Staphylotrichum tortipilum TaxID=2831512 RepID=A0AAN6RVT1_9PEZI|nr:hypothetical protein C8A05DRAFT_31374 [Staphylotrichum longicolle]